MENDPDIPSSDFVNLTCFLFVSFYFPFTYVLKSVGSSLILRRHSPSLCSAPEPPVRFIKIDLYPRPSMSDLGGWKQRLKIFHYADFACFLQSYWPEVSNLLGLGRILVYLHPVAPWFHTLRHTVLDFLNLDIKKNLTSEERALRRIHTTLLLAVLRKWMEHSRVLMVIVIFY